MPNSYRIGELLKGHCALFFTNRNPEEVKDVFQKLEEAEYATGGTIAEKTIILNLSVVHRVFFLKLCEIFFFVYIFPACSTFTTISWYQIAGKQRF